MSDSLNVEGEWDKTNVVFDRLQHNPLFEERTYTNKEGYYAGRRIIGRDTPINKGVYLGQSIREAIVVDDEKYPTELMEAYNELKNWINPTGLRKFFQKDRKKSVFSKALSIAKEKMGGNQTELIEAKVNQMVQKFYDDAWINKGKVTSGDIKVQLNHFIAENAGVCRHRALLVGYMLEKLIDEGQLQGHVSVDRNFIPGKGGHAWVRFVNNEGIMIVDPAMGYAGKLDDAPIAVWDYRRPEDNNKPKGMTLSPNPLRKVS